MWLDAPIFWDKIPLKWVEFVHSCFYDNFLNNSTLGCDWLQYVVGIIKEKELNSCKLGISFHHAPAPPS